MKLRVRFVGILLILATAVMGGPAEARQSWLTWNTRSGLPDNNLTCMAITKGCIAVGSPKGIGLFSESRATWVKLADYGPEFADLTIRSMDFDKHGNLWAATPKGLAYIFLKEFPDKPPRLTLIQTDQGLGTVDVEMVQVHGDRIYVGCFGGWLYEGNIFANASHASFSMVSSVDTGEDDNQRLLAVGITALAMDFPNGGIFSTKGRGILQARDNQSYTYEQALPSDWVNDFWAFQENGAEHVIAVTQTSLNLLRGGSLVRTVELPVKDATITCLTTAPDEETNALQPELPEDQAALRSFLGKRILYVGTSEHGLWQCDEGNWSQLTPETCPLPSYNIHRVHYLHGSKRVAILTDAGLTMFCTEDLVQYDEFEVYGTGKKWGKTFWPFMTRWGFRVHLYPDQMYYPIEPYIAYKKMVRGKDLWVVHDQGISRFVYPQAFFLGSLQLPYKLATRYENPENDPSKNPLVEDSSTTKGRPIGLEGERTWHHYCRQMPNDFHPRVDLKTIFMSLDGKTVAGPKNMLLVEGGPGSLDEEALAARLQTAPETLGWPPVVIYQAGEQCFDARGKEVFRLDTLLVDCPMHPIPNENVTDIAIDLGERCWAIFDDRDLAVLDEPGSVVPESGSNYQPSSDHWIVLGDHQTPWPSGEPLLCIERIGADLFVGTERSGLFILSQAHALDGNDISASSWRNVAMEMKADDAGGDCSVKACRLWHTGERTYVCLLHTDGLSLFDGDGLTTLPVPKRTYTCLAADRRGTLWVGSLQGLLTVTPDKKVHEFNELANGFLSDRIVAMSAAPPDAQYPFLLAGAWDKMAKSDGKHFTSSDVPPYLTHTADNPHKLRVVNTSITGSQLLLFDGTVWESYQYAGIRTILFEEMFLWLGTSCRVFRFYLPVITTIY